MAELLFEIATEELPALIIEPTEDFMREFLAAALKEKRLSHSAIEVYGTPRRLVVMIAELAQKQDDLEEEILGPASQIAFDADGKLTQAGAGFLRSKGIAEGDYYRKATGKAEVMAAKKRTAGELTKDLLPTLLLDMMRKIPFKKRMRWDNSGDSFARPIRSMLCLFDGAYLDLSFANASSGETTTGHRFMSPEPFKVTSIAQYKQEMASRHVVLQSSEREKIFVKSAHEKLAAIGGQLHSDDDLMATVRNLMEYPFVVVGSFEERYLNIPSEILISEMKTHQKCFAVYNADGALMPNFICSAATKPYDDDVFAKGNARVLRARFEDGAFYFTEDLKKTLAQHAELLQTVIFERELGTIADKSDRIARVAQDLAREFALTADETSTARVAAPLIKADLTSGVVGQFPELQGVMGRIYARKENLPNDVALAIEMHYWPRFADDSLPTLRAAAILSLADKLDTLVGIIAIGKKPQGNKDPFALRRAAIGIVRMLVHFGFSIEMEKLIAISLKSYGDKFIARVQAITDEVKEFLLQRARGILIDDLGKENKDYAVNFADSVIAVGITDLLDIFARAHTLFAMRNQSKQEFESLVQAFKRASNIVKKASGTGDNLDAAIDDQFLQESVERDLLSAVRSSSLLGGPPAHGDFASRQNAYVEAFREIATIKPKLDAFFDGVMVMVDDASVRTARLALLSEIKRAADRIADFTHL